MSRVATLTMNPIRPVSDLQKRFAEIEELSQTAPVKLTKNGKNAYVLFTEEELERTIEDVMDEARFEAELSAGVERGIEDIKAGRFHSLDEAIQMIEQQWEERHAL